MTSVNTSQTPVDERGPTEKSPEVHFRATVFNQNNYQKCKTKYTKANIEDP
jgi:hypothetical protein